MGVSGSWLKISGSGLQKSGNRSEWAANEWEWVVVVGRRWDWIGVGRSTV